MKTSSRGPFSGVRWFCHDGTVQPPRGAGCSRHGGGIQHGEWSPTTKQLRSAGYPIATVYAAIDEYGAAALSSDPQRLSFLLLERFLMTYDDGWIFRRARYTRGALQAEDEIAASERLLRQLIANFRPSQYFLLREAVRLLPRPSAYEYLSSIRAISTRLASGDRRFTPLRNKLHDYPDASDAARIIEFADANIPDSRRAPYEELAHMIDQTYSAEGLPESLARLAGFGDRELAKHADQLRLQLTKNYRPQDLYAAYAHFLLFLRENTAGGAASARLAMLETSIQAEQAFYAVGRLLAERNQRATRAELITQLENTVVALFGTGVLSEREYKAARASLAELDSAKRPVSLYYQELRYLTLVPNWAGAQLQFDFGRAIEDFSKIEPLARAYIPDRLRQGPLLYYSQVMARLMSDAAELRGIEHKIFNKQISAGLRALNPGLARGVLIKPREDAPIKPSSAAPGIYLVSETTSELPPVAGILTAREGNLLSHVQLLARNLGVPNIVVEAELLPELERRVGRTIVVAATPGGRVEISADGPEWEEVFDEQDKGEKVVIEPDLDKLDLDFKKIVPLEKLRARDSGRTVGPKAAKLGELKYHFPDEVTSGIAIPFGVFRAVLDGPYPPGAGTTFFAWLQSEYRALAARRDSREIRAQRTRELLERARSYILGWRFSPSFTSTLRSALNKHLGPEGSYGVFVRSDSNVEDLPSFTGAGLNLTVPNVVRFDQILPAVLQVWASVFTERAFAWRQSAMREPEHVYISVLLLKSIPSEKSGVLVTADVDNGDPDFITVAANSGIAGVVANQAAESLRIRLGDGTVRLYSSAAAHSKLALAPQGGLQNIPIQSRERVLAEAELLKLHTFAENLTDNFPEIEDASGDEVPGEIEFGFVRGRLVLFQIRPFLQSMRRSELKYLRSLDRDEDSGKQRSYVDLNAIPGRLN